MNASMGEALIYADKRRDMRSFSRLCEPA